MCPERSLSTAGRLVAAAGLLLAGCSSATQQTYVAPTSETIVSTTEQHQADPPVHLIYVINRSTVPVRVFSVTLTGCENVRFGCGVRSVSLRIPPRSRQVAARVEPEDKSRAFRYQFGFSWHADSSSVTALSALAAVGDTRAQARLDAIRRADSLTRATGYKELSREDFVALAGRIARLHGEPDSLVLAPGERTSIARIHLLVADSQGVVLGRTGWVRWQVPGAPAVRFVPPDQLIARAPGRFTIRFALAEEAQALVQRTVPDIEYPVVVAYPPDPHAPTFAGLVVDADSKTPLACARIALEDSAQNVVARGRTVKDGTFIMSAPRPGTYRVRVETFGWAPAYGPLELANADETKQQQYNVSFVERLLTPRRMMAYDDFEHAYPASVSTTAGGGRGGGGVRPLVRGVTLGGSESMPILGIIGDAPAGTTWMQFVVDSTGRVDTTSVLLPTGTSTARVASVRSMLPRVRFSPAREDGRPTCEMVRMQVNFSRR